jgi:hypothetical protein
VSIIEFINTKNIVDKKLFPQPSRNVMPEWYKQMPSYSKDQPNLENDAASRLALMGGMSGPATIKKCMPVFDSLSAGYLLLLHMDLIIFRQEGSDAPWYRWPDGREEEISFHEFYQVDGFPKAQKNLPVAKFKNPWGIKTRPGYSSLFVSPLNRDTPIEILSGTVDTDFYNIPVIFPFTLKDPNWTGLIPAGTPIAQVIPFKREKYTHKIVDMEQAKKGKMYQKNLEAISSTFYKAYRNNFWQRKEYR